ncbi:phenol hydroxylase subunit P4 [Halarcobacter sp.]|uniref:phenol hydroxylase subunit P4 n=1 Tax=Halarcobacter sp. TaxID=2321133 RepID=UPI002AA87D6A|nr:phenol hydroxylase subunit P4 [Halarcobacter sp.]
MATKHIGDYNPKTRDVVENFHGNIVVYVGWDKHRMINSAMAFPLPPAMPFNALLNDVLPSCFKDHPDFEKLDWDTTQINWQLNGEPFNPQKEKSLEENGIDHKSLIQFETPTLKGLNGLGM